MSGPDLARAARRLIGTPFRLHGRDPQTGLDCIGVFSAAMADIGQPIAPPGGYAARLRDLDAFLPLSAVWGFTEASGETQPGDVLMFAVGPVQFHLAIAAERGLFVHAHAGLRRTVLGPAGAEWRVTGHWRLIDQD